MIAGLTGDRQSSKTVLKMKESCEVKYDDECLLDEERFELMQQKELIDSLLNEEKARNGDCVIVGDDATVSHIENLIIDKSLNGKEQSPEVVMKMKDQNFILMENEVTLFDFR